MTSSIEYAASMGAEWATFFNDDTHQGRYFEYFYGNYGKYEPHQGFKIDFYPYDMTRSGFEGYITDYMRQFNYI